VRPRRLHHGSGHRRARRLAEGHARHARGVRAGKGAKRSDRGDGADRRRNRRGDDGHAPDRRDHVRGLPHAGDGAARQPRRQGALHVRWPAQGAADGAHAGRRRLVVGSPARAADRGLVRRRARAEGRLSLDAARRARTALVVYLRRQLRRLLRARPALQPARGAIRGTGADSARQGAHRQSRRGRDRGRDRTARARGAGGGRASRAGRDLGRGRRSAHLAAARRGGDTRVGAKDEPLRGRTRGGTEDGIRSGGGSAGSGEGFRLARCSGREGRRLFLTASLRALTRAACVPRRDQVYAAIKRTVGSE